jgi:hypothetical protein
MFCIYRQYIPRAFFLTLAARRVYRISAILSVLLFFGWVQLFVFGVSPGSQPLVRPFLFIGALAAGITYVGMQFYLLCFDNSHPLKQIVWFCVMLVPFLGSALYCLVVYSRFTQPNPATLPA